MQSIFLEFEEAGKSILNTTEKHQVFQQAIRFFLEKDVKLTIIDGVSYVENPERYRKSLVKYFYEIAVKRKQNESNKVK